MPRPFPIVAITLVFGALAPTSARAGTVKGVIDGIFGTPGAQYVSGWTCETGSTASLNYDVYTGGVPGVGQLYGRFVANSANDSGVTAACGNSNGHRFYFGLSGDIFARSGKKVFIYGISTSSGTNTQLDNSGMYTIPRATISSTLDSINVSGLVSGWAYDKLDASRTVEIHIYADGLAGQGAGTGALVWSGSTTVSRPDVNSAFNISGFTDFPPSYLSGRTRMGYTVFRFTQTVSTARRAGLWIPRVPGSSVVHGAVSLTASATGFPSKWLGIQLPPGTNNLVGLTGSVSLDNSAGLYSETLFLVSALNSGTCPTAGTSIAPEKTDLWQVILKAPTQGTSRAAVDFTLPVSLPVSSCVLVGISGGAVSSAHSVTSSIALDIVYNQAGGATAHILPAGGEYCFGQDWGCPNHTTDNSLSFANVTRITQRGLLVALWGNISDSTFDGTSNFGATPGGNWSAKNDIYVYHGADCSQFGNATENGPANYYAAIPSTATHVLDGAQSGHSGPNAPTTIDFLQVGLTTGANVYLTPNLQLNSGDCIVTLFGMSGSYGAFDNETQITGIVQPN